MVFGLKRIFGGSGDSIDGEVDSTLPEYFPVVPKGCELKSETLFACIGTEATARLRAIENGDCLVKGGHDERQDNLSTESSDSVPQSVGRQEVDPLAVCRESILAYKKCCAKALKKKQNWILTEPFRVQEEYRYNSGDNP